MLQLGQEEKENNSVKGKEGSSLLCQTWGFCLDPTERETHMKGTIQNGPRESGIL
jgi:hypothetical protein